MGNAIVSFAKVFRSSWAIRPSFVLGPSLLGLPLHVLLSAAFGVVYGGAAEAFAPRRARVWYWEGLMGLAYGVLVWTFSGYGGCDLVDLQDALLASGYFLLAHLLYGAVLDLSLAALTTKRDLLTVTFAPEERAVRETVDRR